MRLLTAYWLQVLIFLVAFALALLWFGVGAALFVLPFGLLGVLPIAGLPWPGCAFRRADAAGTRLLREAIDDTFSRLRKGQEHFACILVEIDDHDALFGPHDQAEVGRVMTLCRERLALRVRRDDALFDMPPGRIAILLMPGTALDQSATLSLARRLQTALAHPVPLGSSRVLVSASLGICIDAALTERSGRAMIAALEAAVTAAVRDGPSAIRFHGDGHGNGRGDGHGNGHGNRHCNGDDDFHGEEPQS